MVLGKAAVNIRHMDVGPSQRKQQAKGTHDTALMVISVDNDIPEWALHEIGETGDIFGVTVVHL